MQLRQKVGRLLEAAKATNFVNLLVLLGTILPPKMAF
jgi:hypothetical protein